MAEALFDLIVVIPVYNEEGCIEEVVTSWGAFLNQYLKTEKFKILVVNDGSKDNTPAILDKLATSLSYLEVVHQKNGGHGNAVLNGYRKALSYNPSWVFQTDSDNQFRPEDFPLLWEQRNESNFLLGYRRKRYDDANRLLITRIVRLVNLMFFRVYIPDSNVPYRLIKGPYLKRLMDVMPHNPFAPNIFLSVLARRDGQDLKSIPVVHKERETGVVSIIKWKLLKVCLRTTRELFAFSFSLKRNLRLLRESR